jgi:hypothetical protein
VIESAEDLTRDHWALLRAVLEEQGDTEDRLPSTRAVGERLLAIYKNRGGSYSWHATAPWHGTAPMASELETLGLLEYEVGMAQFHPPGVPTLAADEYWLRITDAGRSALADFEARM